MLPGTHPNARSTSVRFLASLTWLLRPALRLLVFLTAGCTAHYPVNEVVDDHSLNERYGFANPRIGGVSETTLFFAAFSGGGTRAAAFSYGALEKLAATRVTADDGAEVRLLDEVDGITSVSGGSFTAAYFGLFGDRIFEDFESNLLQKKRLMKK